MTWQHYLKCGHLKFKPALSFQDNCGQTIFFKITAIFYIKTKENKCNGKVCRVNGPLNYLKTAEIVKVATFKIVDYVKVAELFID